ncbi:helix-turn-helix and ligand-binding sensor domain-containing protein [Flavobacterium silvaticum]|uniref:Histidine kinase n=1 Tax=Flavobacterium silvaticum TaxID=1852020 RepID=A0A972JF85_9FLAO|nr:histidine kinase [Flavobacterium silvaticum]NMH26966.1 histidine kinase [Flavobacterium silvaticum]
MKSLLRFIPLLLLPSLGWAQNILPFTENFTKSDYNGENQVWSITQAQDHSLCFANNKYFLRYDGVAWERSALPAQTAIRSLYSYDDRVYCGSYKEFGYWQRKDGQLKYHSLSSGRNLFTGVSENEEIWKIFRFKSQIYFQSFNELFVYDGGSIRKIRLPFQVSYFYQAGRNLYAASVKEGVFLFDGKDFQPVLNWGLAKGKIVHAIESVENETFVFTKTDGVFRTIQNGLEAWKHPLNSVFKKEVILSAKYLGNNQMAVGTSLNGLYLVNLKTSEFRHLNRSNSILNNTILNIFSDQEGDLWLGLDNGIAHVEVQSPVGLYTDNSGGLGTVYAIAEVDKNTLLLASNHGVFKWKNGAIAQIPGSQGQVWDIAKVSNRFLVGHNDGFFEISGDLWKPINSVNGGWKFFSDVSAKRYFQASYTGIATYGSLNEMQSPKYVYGLTKPIRDAVQESPDVLWASDNYRGLYRIELGNELGKDKVMNITEKQHFTNDYSVRLLKLANKVYALIGQKWFEFDKRKNLLQPSAFLNKSFNEITDVYQSGTNEFLMNRRGILYKVIYKSGNFEWQIIPPKYYSGKLVTGNTKAFSIEGKTYINLDDGFLALYGHQSANSRIRIEAFSSGTNMKPNQFVGFGKAVEIRVISEWFGYKKPTVYYKVDDDSQVIPVQNGRIWLNNLSGGRHSVLVFDFDGKSYKELTRYEFRTRYPWYFSNLMIAIYVVVAALSFFLYYRWNKLRTDQRLKLQEETLRHHNEIAQMELRAENDEKHRAYEKQILELEVKSKTGEIAGKSLSIAKQSEMIDTILSIVETEEDPSRIKTKIRKAVRGNELNKQEWEAFENNLNQINEGFTSRLLEKYPDLSPREIKLCIHLRMNLSSKEIAPLMNISYRGVELQRYRLRKKIGVSTEANLNQLMMAL